MFRSKTPPQPTDRPDLVDRTFAEGCTRLSVISLHAGAGARTVLESIANELHARGVAIGITRAPRLELEADSVPDSMAPIELPAGTIVATTDRLADGHEALEPLGPAGHRTALGEVGFYRLRRGAEVRVYGPDDPPSIASVLRRLDETSGGLALVDGAWERRGFAAPSVAEGVILAVGAGYAPTPERSAGAVRYTAEILGLPRAEGPVVRAWFGADAGANVLDVEARVVECLRGSGETLVAELESLGPRARAVVLPDGLHDELLGPLIRSSVRCTLVIEDPTCMHAAPVYYSAWGKLGGEVAVVEPTRVFAVATNPVNLTGPDADAERFRTLVAESLPDLPVHDVRLEAERSRKKAGWRIWT